MLNLRALRAIECEIVPEGASDLVVDLGADVIGHIILTNVENLVEVCILVVLLVNEVSLIVPTFICVLCQLIGFVLLDERHQLCSHGHEILHISEAELQVLLCLPGEMIDQAQVFFLADFDRLDILGVLLVQVEDDFSEGNAGR